MSGDAHAAQEAALSRRVQQAVKDLNDAASEAAQIGIEPQITLIEHQSVGSPVKRQIVTARLVRPIAAT